MGDARADGPGEGEAGPEAAPSEPVPSQAGLSELGPDDVAAAVDAVVDGAHDGTRGSTVRRRAEVPAEPAPGAPAPLVPPAWAGRGSNASGAPGVRPGVAVPSSGYVRFSEGRRRPGVGWAVAVVVVLAALAAAAVIVLL